MREYDMTGLPDWLLDWWFDCSKNSRNPESCCSIMVGVTTFQSPEVTVLSHFWHNTCSTHETCWSVLFSYLRSMKRGWLPFSDAENRLLKTKQPQPQQPHESEIFVNYNYNIMWNMCSKQKPSIICNTKLSLQYYTMGRCVSRCITVSTPLLRLSWQPERKNQNLHRKNSITISSLRNLQCMNIQQRPGLCIFGAQPFISNQLYTCWAYKVHKNEPQPSFQFKAAIVNLLHTTMKVIAACMPRCVGWLISRRFMRH